MKRLDHYSQHFIRRPQLVEDLLRRARITSDDTVYDIGAGSGVISSVLARHARHVVAIEYEPRTAEKLRSNMAAFDNVTVVQANILDYRLPRGRYKVFANIPFHLSSPIVRHLTEAKHPPEAIYLIVQKQFAHKLLPNSSRFTGQLGMMVGPRFAVSIKKSLQRTDFWPHPNVDTVLLEMLRRPEPLLPLEAMPAYRQFIDDCFSTPRVFQKMPRAEVGISLTAKPSELHLDDWLRLFKAIALK